MTRTYTLLQIRVGEKKFRLREAHAYHSGITVGLILGWQMIDTSSPVQLERKLSAWSSGETD